MLPANFLEAFLGLLLLTSSLGVILLKQPVHACLSFLVSLLGLACLYLELSAFFIATLQILVYAGAILVLFMFVIVLFQDAHLAIWKKPSQSSLALLIMAMTLFTIAAAYFFYQIGGYRLAMDPATPEFGNAVSIGRAIFLDFFFPFEAVIMLFLISLVGSVYLGTRERVDG